MNTQISISISDNHITVSGPYSPSNNEIYRSIGGKFSDGSWSIPDTQNAREQIADLFGTKSDLITVEIPVGKILDDDIVQIGGYVLASRRGRDARVTIPDGVFLAAGTIPPSGGSVKYPRVDPSSNAVFHLVCRKSWADKNGLTQIAQTEASIEI